MISKPIALLLACLLLAGLSLPALAEGAHPGTLPAAVHSLIETEYPAYSLATHNGWGDDAHGQWALTLSEAGHNVLCIAEKSPADVGYRFTVATDRALRQGEQTPRLLIDTGGDALFISYASTQSLPYSVSYSASKQGDRWLMGDVLTVDEQTGFEYLSHIADGLLHTEAIYTDGNDNIISRRKLPALPAGQMVEGMSLDTFDASIYPLLPRDLVTWVGQQLLPADSQLLGGVACPAGIGMTAVDGDGHRLYLLGADAAGKWVLTHSAPMPPGAGFDADLSWNLLWVKGLYPDSDGYSAAFTCTPEGLWALRLVQAKDTFHVLPSGLQDSAQPDTIYPVGSHPWGDIRTLDVAALPISLAQATAQLDTHGWAVVNNPNPADRLHLRTENSQQATSLAKFYNGSAVRVLQIDGAWARVRIGGLEGWMMKRYLAFGKDMNSVRRVMPQSIRIKDEHLRDGLPLYARTTDLHPLPGRRTFQDLLYNTAAIGVVGDQWYYLWLDDGSSGYQLQSWYWPGHG